MFIVAGILPNGEIDPLSWIIGHRRGELVTGGGFPVFRGRDQEISPAQGAVRVDLLAEDVHVLHRDRPGPVVLPGHEEALVHRVPLHCRGALFDVVIVLGFRAQAEICLVRGPGDPFDELAVNLGGV